MTALRMLLISTMSICLAGCAAWNDRTGSRATMNAAPVNSGFQMINAAPPPVPMPLQPMNASLPEVPAPHAPTISLAPAKLYNLEPSPERKTAVRSTAKSKPVSEEVLTEVPEIPAAESSPETAQPPQTDNSEADTAILARPVRKGSRSSAAKSKSSESGKNTSPQSSLRSGKSILSGEKRDTILPVSNPSSEPADLHFRS